MREREMVGRQQNDMKSERMRDRQTKTETERVTQWRIRERKCEKRESNL